MSERRDPYDYHVRLSAGGPWRVATMQLHDSVEKWLVAGGAKRIYDTDDLAEIGPRILPPGSDPSPAAPAHTTDATCKERLMTEDQVKYMVDRFLNWRLPQPWNPDNGISYRRPNYAHPPAEHDWPTGTNLFDAQQAAEMVRHMLDGLPDAPDIAATITSAVEQERDRLLPAEPREDLILTIAKAICGQRWSHLNAGEEEREKGRARALYEAIRSRSAETPDTEGGE